MTAYCVILYVNFLPFFFFFFNLDIKGGQDEVIAAYVPSHLHFMLFELLKVRFILNY